MVLVIPKVNRETSQWGEGEGWRQKTTLKYNLLFPETESQPDDARHQTISGPRDISYPRHYLLAVAYQNENKN